MIYTIGLYSALALVLIGLFIRFIRWFRIELGPDVAGFSPFEKLVSMTRIKLKLFSSASGLISLLRVLVNDILLQKRLLVISPLRWGIHLALFYGFLLLVLLHVFDQSIALIFFPRYLSTLTPWMFLRNLLGFMVLVCGITALVRRCSDMNIRSLSLSLSSSSPPPPPPSSSSSSPSSSSSSSSSSSTTSSIGSFTAPDILLLVVMLMIILSGFFLESTQIISQGLYEEMVEDYSDLEEEGDLSALANYWEAEYGVIFSDFATELTPDKEHRSGKVNTDNAMDTSNSMESGNTTGTGNGKFNAESELDMQLKLGSELNEAYCIECHSRPVNAFFSYTLSRIISPIGTILNSVRADQWFWYFHILSSFLALALLPFTKIFHLVSTPLSLAMNGSEMTFTSDVKPALALKRAVELDACVQCGACSAVCSVAPMARSMGNRDILPSEKIKSIKHYTIDTMGGFWLHKNGLTLHQKTVDPVATSGLARGSHICTDCFRCNEVCPAGIDLKDIWNASKKSLDLKGFSPTHTEVNRQHTMAWAEQYKKDNPRQTFREKQDRFDKIPSDPAVFSTCVQCSICSNVCPVVEVSRSHSHDPGLTPQQVMNLLRLEMRDVAMFSGMVWNCTTCYMCQEHCPQGIQVADILCSLRNRACEYLESETIKEAVK